MRHGEPLAPLLSVAAARSQAAASVSPARPPPCRLIHILSSLPPSPPSSPSPSPLPPLCHLLSPSAHKQALGCANISVSKHKQVLC